MLANLPHTKFTTSQIKFRADSEDVSDIFKEFLTIESQGTLDRLLKGKESKADLKPNDEEQSREID